MPAHDRLICPARPLPHEPLPVTPSLARDRPARRPAAVGVLLMALALAFAPGRARAQQPRRVTLAQAIAAALAAPRVAAARADSAEAAAGVREARAFPNPDLAYDYSEAVPGNHLVAEQALEYPWVRSARVQAAGKAASAVSYLLRAERAAVRHDAEVAYVQAAAAHEIAGLSRRNLTDSEELVRIATARREAGDAAELDVLLAGVAASQARNTYLTDSLSELTTLLDLQAVMGMHSERVEIELADSLAALPELALPADSSGRAIPLLPERVSAAEATLASKRAALSEARRGRLPAPALRAGVEWGDPSQPGNLPTFGISVPIPLWNRGGSAVAAANAGVARAEAALALTRLQTRNAIARAGRERVLARDRARRDQATIKDAQRVARLSLTAYHEGAYPLASALEAQRSARDALRQFIDDLAAARTAEAAYVLARTAGADPGDAPAPPASAPGGGTP